MLLTSVLPAPLSVGSGQDGTSMLELLTALLTPLIAAIAVYIAYQQWQTNRRRLDVDLYDRRLRIYETVTKYISAVLTTLHPTLEDLLEFRRSTAEADFLFGSDIRKYLDDLFAHGLELRKWQEKYRDSTQDYPADDDHNTVVEGQTSESSWFADQHEIALRRFKEYLNLLPEKRCFRH